MRASRATRRGDEVAACGASHEDVVRWVQLADPADWGERWIVAIRVMPRFRRERGGLFDFLTTCWKGALRRGEARISTPRVVGGAVVRGGWYERDR